MVMIHENDKYLFAINNDDIRHIAGISLTDRECEDIAYVLDAAFDNFIRTSALDYRVGHPRKHPSFPKVIARVSLQVWRNDYAEEVKEVLFDCAPALEKFDLSDLPDDGDFIGSGCCNCGDDVFYTASSIGLVNEWDGPFSFYIDNEDEYAEYIAVRKAKED